jgi:hypothetical protein
MSTQTQTIEQEHGDLIGPEFDNGPTPKFTFADFAPGVRFKISCRSYGRKRRLLEVSKVYPDSIAAFDVKDTETRFCFSRTNLHYYATQRPDKLEIVRYSF